MYLESWQVFLGGCVVGTLISLIVLFVFVVNMLNRFGVKAIQIHDVSENADTGDEEVEDVGFDEEADLLAKLSFILSTRGYLTDDDMKFMMDQITFDEWKEVITAEIDEMESNQDDEC